MLSTLLISLGQLPKDLGYIIIGYVPEVCDAVCIKHIQYPDFHRERMKWHLTKQYEFMIASSLRAGAIYVEIYNCLGDKVKVITIPDVKSVDENFQTRYNTWTNCVFIESSRGIIGYDHLTSEELKKLEFRLSSYEVYMDYQGPKGWYNEQIDKTPYFKGGIIVRPTISEFYQMCNVLSTKESSLVKKNSGCIIL